MSLDFWTRGSFSSDGFTHDITRRSGPGVIIIHEIPGMTPAVIAFADEVATAGFTVVMPHLFGKPSSDGLHGRDLHLATGCMCEQAAHDLSTQQNVARGELAAGLARDLQAETGGPGVGASGMCLTGGFTLAMMVDPAVAATVVAAVAALPGRSGWRRRPRSVPGPSSTRIPTPDRAVSRSVAERSTTHAAGGDEAATWSGTP